MYMNVCIYIETISVVYYNKTIYYLINKILILKYLQI